MLVIIKNIKNYSLLSCVILFLSATSSYASEPHRDSALLPFNNTQLSVDERVDDLLSRLTLDEKVAQMFDKSPAIERLDIPEYQWWNEALHGVARAGEATVFPQAIGLAATFDESLLLRIGDVIATEGRAKHQHFLAAGSRTMYTGLTYWSPNINIFRDPRWGRGQETYGEDPYLTTRMAVNFVNGLQGSDSQYLKAVATLKHYAVHSGPEVSRHSDDYRPSKKDFIETYIAAFRDTIAESQPASIMCAYNRVNGEPACGSDTLLKDYLRNDFGFTGYVVSDCGAISDFYELTAHHIVNSPAKAAAKAVKSGTDLNCGAGLGNTYDYLKQAVNENLITEQEIDVAVRRLLLARFQLGMFDAEQGVKVHPQPYEVVGSTEHLNFTQEAAEKSLVLLKNDGILPLNRDKKLQVAVIGPNANNQDILVGNYHGKPINPVTPLQGIQQYLGNDYVTYAPGSSLAGGIYSHYQPVPAEYFFHKDGDGELASGLMARYHAEPHFEMQPVLVRVDDNIHFQWQNSPIDNSVNDEFAVEWTGYLRVDKTATYEFSTSNLELTLDNKAVSGPIKLKAGQLYEVEALGVVVAAWHSNVIEPSIQLNWVNTDTNLAKEAIKVAKDSDVVIFFGGISARLEGEESSLLIDGFAHGDRTHINLPASQEKLLKALHKTGKPVIYVNFSGSAMALNWQHKHLPAIVQAFYPGEAAGTALARLLWGEYSPSGRLPITFYQSVDELPEFIDYTMENRTYKYFKGKVLYPFGFGLGYNRIQYSPLTLSENANGDIHIEVALTNLGDTAQNEVAQVYIAMPDAPVKTPLKQLVRFARQNIAPSASVQTTFTLLKDELQYVDNEGIRQPYTGTLLVAVGGDSSIDQQFTAIEINP